MPEILLSAQKLSKSFPGVKALDQVDFELGKGEIHALMGENGAGKSTLIKVITGIHNPDAGSILLDGVEIHPHSPQDAEQVGISTVYQEVNLIPHLSVAENICLGRQKTRLGMIDWKDTNRRAKEALAKFEIEIDVTQELCSYSIAIQQMIAIARAVDVDAKVLILDEPTASLDEKEVEELFTVLRRLREKEISIVFITHFLDQVYALSDRITVLRNGKWVGSYETKHLPKLELISKMLGKSVDDLKLTGTADAANNPKSNPQPHTNTQVSNESKTTSDTGNTLLKATGFSKKGVLGEIDLQINRGETIGLAGLLGSGRTETAQLIFGILHSETGKLYINDKDLHPFGSPKAAIDHKIAFCSEDRKKEGIIPHLSIRENIILALQAKNGIFKRISSREQETIADDFIEKLNIKTPSRETAIRNLSGGNQQKVLLARWLATQPDLIILDEPTRGIDIGAKDEIEELVNELQTEGMSVLLISSELEEIVRMCHRVWVLRDRECVGTIDGETINEDTIMNLIAHGNE